MNERADVISVRGARMHNLQNVSIELPRDALVVFTGVSGSGKSSLAFDTIYAEGQRRYLDGLSTYARQFLDQLERPDVDAIDGLPPTVAIDQKAGATNPRSTVATVTEIHDYLRLLYARVGLPHCPSCGLAIDRRTPEQIVDSVLALGEGKKVMIMAPLVRGRKGSHKEAFEAIRRAGMIRARVNGEIIEIQNEPTLAKTKTHTVEAVIDRLVVREGIRPRLAESVNLALKLADGVITLAIAQGDGWLDKILSVKYACPGCGIGFAPLEPRSFSFNSPYGACPDCGGMGVRAEFDPDLVIPERTKSLNDGAIAAWTILKPNVRETVQEDPAFVAFLKSNKLTRSTALKSWSAKQFKMLLEGDAATGFSGILAGLKNFRETLKSESLRTALDAFRVDETCSTCAGTRLRPESRAVTIGGSSLPTLLGLTTEAASEFLGTVSFEPPADLIGPPLIKEVRARLAFLGQVGLAYLSLDRPTDTLSGGELQRVRLAAQIGSGLVGVAYVLDEPTAGLHPSDTNRLLASLLGLRDRGNSVIVVEHDEITIRAADWLVDIGPGAGPNGGRIVAQGTPQIVIETSQSSTARYLRGEIKSPARAIDRLRQSPGSVIITGASERNLKNIAATFPVGTLTCVTGVSGSGKSTLVHEILGRCVRRHLGMISPRPGAHTLISGLELFDKLIEVDQGPIGRGPRSTPATFTGVFDEIRHVFARTKEAKMRGYGAARFSFNAKGGRCETCQGQGARKIVMKFLPDLFVTCETCEGKRFNPPTLEVKFRDTSIGDVLKLRVDEALRIFENQPKVRRSLEALQEAGLGYVALGQSSTTLSGGEAQRVKLASELGRIGTGKTLYILDEPTTGLHFADVTRLLETLQKLVDLGNTVIVIEHNCDVVRASDWVIDLGPGAGDSGGQVVAMGTPETVTKSTESQTGLWLREHAFHTNT